MISEIKNNLKLLIEKIKTHHLDGYLIPSNDEFQSEYVPEHLNRLKFITGFSGSNGLALITPTQNLFFTDGRYILQAEQELNGLFEIHNLNDLFNKLPKLKIGYDPKLHTALNIQRYKAFNLVASPNLVDLIWQDKKAQATSKIFTYPLKYAGETSTSKTEKLKAYLTKDNIDALIITDPSNICWLLNIRAHDIAYNPILLSYLIFYQDGTLELFSNIPEVKNTETQCYPLNKFIERLELLKDKKVQLDPDSASIFISNNFRSPILKQDPCFMAKACKNNIEIKQAKRIHIIDGLAVTRLLYWLDKNYLNQSEISVADKLLEFRKLNPDFIYLSFPTIAGFASNGAIIHYHANKKTNKTLTGNGLLLLDSGGQYFGGTTDITRVIPIGKPSYQQKLNFTLILKGHIAYANCKFIPGTTGGELDILARYYLWQDGKNYAHASGHGVGNCLNVHEGRMGNVALSPGMIIANEPGYYKNGEYGIRIENLLLVRKQKNGFLAMETLTLAPIDKRLILTKMLSKQEKSWLNQYHKKIYNKLSPHLNTQEKSWLKSKTLAL